MFEMRARESCIPCKGYVWSSHIWGRTPFAPCAYLRILQQTNIRLMKQESTFRITKRRESCNWKSAQKNFVQQISY